MGGVQIYNNPSSVKVMAWHRIDGKPVPEFIMA